MKASRHYLLVVGIVGMLVFCWPFDVYGGKACVVPDNGTGTITLPPAGCDYNSPGDVFRIIDGLPPGTTIEMEGILMNFICNSPFCTNCTLPLPPGVCEMLGGSLGGLGHCFEADLDLTVTGTGSLEGFNRHLVVPVCAGSAAVTATITATSSRMSLRAIVEARIL